MNSLQSVGSPSLLQRIATLRTQPGPARDSEMQQFQDALDAELQKTVGPVIQGWSCPHVEKAAFPFQVNKQASRWSPIARAQLAQNMSAAVGLLANPAVSNALLIGVETRLDPKATPTSHDLADPEFRRFYDAVRNAGSQQGNFTFEGTLVNVGWGSGDHVNVGSDYLPAGPNTTSNSLARSVTQQMF
ncbi:MAG: hypothetical protein ACYCW6_05880 [Candidatus Xenobia bacterium]